MVSTLRSGEKLIHQQILTLIGLCCFYSVKENPPGKDLNASECEFLLTQLLIDEYIETKIVWTKYE